MPRAYRDLVPGGAPTYAVVMRNFALLATLALVGTGCGRAVKIKVKAHKLDTAAMPIDDALETLQRAQRHVLWDPANGRDGRADPAEIYYATDTSAGRTPTWKIAPDDTGWGVYRLWEGDWHLLGDHGADFVAAVPTKEVDQASAALYGDYSPVVMAWGTEVLYIRIARQGYYSSSTSLASMPGWGVDQYRFDFAEWTEIPPPDTFRLVLACEEMNERYQHAECLVYALPWRDGRLDAGRPGYAINPDRRDAVKLMFVR